MTHVDTQTPTLGLSAWPGTLSHWDKEGAGAAFLQAGRLLSKM